MTQFVLSWPSTRYATMVMLEPRVASSICFHSLPSTSLYYGPPDQLIAAVMVVPSRHYTGSETRYHVRCQRLLCKGIVEIFLLRDIPLAQQPAQEMDEEHLIFICKSPPVTRVGWHGLYRRFRAWYESASMILVDRAASPRADASSSLMFGQRRGRVEVV